MLLEWFASICHECRLNNEVTDSLKFILLSRGIERMEKEEEKEEGIIHVDSVRTKLCASN